jgi:sugar phosphate isomerase/epimerase
MGVPGDMNLQGAGAEWKQALEGGGCTVVTVFAAFEGEDYSDAPAVQRTVGFIPKSTRAAREKRMLAVSDFAAEMRVPSIATHIGFVPEDDRDEDYLAVREVVRRVCDHAARRNQTFALETGQETAEALRHFFIDVNRENLRVNFDPANMIMYGTGDPFDALHVLQQHVITVHCKDGEWPPKGVPGALGTEKPLGQGSVGIERFVQKLKEIGYTGPLTIEREAQDPQERLRDIRMAVGLLEKLRG